MVYPHTIIRPMPKYKVDSKKYLTSFIKDLGENNCVIKAFIADNLKRAIARLALNHASSFACEYCFSKASSYSVDEQQTLAKRKNIEDQIAVIENRMQRLQEQEEQDPEELETLQSIVNNLTVSLRDIKKKKQKLVWPSSTMNSEARTQEKIMEIVNKIERNEPLTKDECKGITGRSPFLDLHYFNLVRDIPAEYLHCMCLGVIKRMVELTFNVGIARPRVVKRRLTEPSVFNQKMSKIKVTREFPGRVRNLDFSVMKGQEFRNIGLFFFIVVVDCLEEHKQERRIWLLLGFMLRACVIPQHEFQNVNFSDIEFCRKQFYTLYEKLYGETNCSYNTHVVGAHLPEIRAHGPLTLTSAFGFENFYGEMRHAFVPRTISPLKQIMKKILIKRALLDHQCSPNVHITNHNTALECNNLIYTYTHRVYNFYKVVDIQNDEDILNCVKINTSEVFYEETPNLNWDQVGIFKQESIDTQIVNIEQVLVAGKVIQIEDTLLTCPMNVLDEK